MMKKASLKFKMISLFLLVGLIPMLAITLLSYNNSSNEIRAGIYSSMEMYAAVAAENIEFYFDNIRNDASIMAVTRDIYQSFNILRDENWNTNSFQWRERERIIDTLMAALAEDKGYILIYLTNPQGQIIYSTDRGFLGDDISRRDYIQSSLQGRTSWSQLFFSNITNTNVMAVSAPIRSDGQTGDILGTLNITVDDARIAYRVHNGLDELGETADAYLIDDTGLLYSNTLLGEFRQDAALRERINTRAVELLSGPIRRGDVNFHAVDEYPDYQGNPVLGSLDVMRLGDMTVGLIVEMDVDEALAGIVSMRNVMIIFAILALAAIAAFSYLIARSLSTPIEKLAKVAEEVANGDLRVKSDIERGDEIGVLATSFNTMIDNLREIVQAVRKSAEETSSTSQELASSTEETNASIEEVAASVTQFTSTTDQLSQNSQNMADSTEEVNTLAHSGQEQMDKTQLQMQDIIKSAEEAGVTIKGLEKSSQEIENIAGVISSVADQTNLLALNAAIEAARAGEHGQGFAVVADEVRKLAEETQKSVGEIKEIITRLSQSTGEAVSVIDGNNAQISVGAETLKETGKAFTQIVEKISAVTSAVQDVASASEELSASCQEISAATQEQSASMEEISSSAENLSAMAEELTALIERLTI